MRGVYDTLRWNLTYELPCVHAVVELQLSYINNLLFATQLFGNVFSPQTVIEHAIL